jgi:hypothetical protein
MEIKWIISNHSQQEELEDTKGVIRGRISKNKQHNNQQKMYKRTNSDLQNIDIKPIKIPINLMQAKIFDRTPDLVSVLQGSTSPRKVVLKHADRPLRTLVYSEYYTHCT